MKSKKTVEKTVKQYSMDISDINELQFIGKQYATVKNYVYSRYSGINNFHILNDYKKEIRDIWVKNNFAEQWKLPARYWKLALDEAISNIKSVWSNTINKVRSGVLRNNNLTKNEIDYILYILKANKLLGCILTNRTFDRPVKINDLQVREKYVHNLLRRLIRRYKGTIPYTHKTNVFQIDANMYNYEFNTDERLVIHIQSSKWGKRVNVILKSHNQNHGNLRVILSENSLELHSVVDTLVRENQLNKPNIIGVDKGYRRMIATSTGNFYGNGLNNFLSVETERLNALFQKRNKLWALMKKYEAEGNFQKAENIKKNNLGYKKYNRTKNRHEATVKSYINHELNRMYLEEKPSMVVSEDLSFVSWKDKFPKHIKRKLSRWIKGYIKERLEYKNALFMVEHKLVNPAYTSQVCSKCGQFGERKGEVFTCKCCGKMDADYNAAVNIEKRKCDKEITLYTPYKKVKSILQLRLKTA